MKQLTLLALSLFPLALTGCFGGAIACDFREEHDRCQERTGIQAANPLAFEGTCATAGGTYRDDGCPDEGRVAGCEIGADVIDWYYAPESVESVTAECEGDGTLVLP